MGKKKIKVVITHNILLQIIEKEFGYDYKKKKYSEEKKLEKKIFYKLDLYAPEEIKFKIRDRFLMNNETPRELIPKIKKMIQRLYKVIKFVPLEEELKELQILSLKQYRNRQVIDVDTLFFPSDALYKIARKKVDAQYIWVPSFKEEYGNKINSKSLQNLLEDQEEDKESFNYIEIPY